MIIEYKYQQAWHLDNSVLLVIFVMSGIDILKNKTPFQILDFQFFEKSHSIIMLLSFFFMLVYW